MNNAQKTRIKKAAVRLLGSFGYFFNVLQWMIVFVIYQTAVVGFVTSISPPAPSQPTPPPQIIDPGVSLGASEPNVFMSVLAVIIVVATIALSIYVFIKTPSYITKSNKKVVERAADMSTTISLRVQQKPDTPRRRKKLHGMWVVVIKCIVVIVPLGLSLMAGVWSDGALETGAAVALGAGLAAITGFFFAAQYAMAALLRIKPQDVV